MGNNSPMSELQARVLRKNFPLTGRNLETDPRLKVGSDLTALLIIIIIKLVLIMMIMIKFD